MRGEKKHHSMKRFPNLTVSDYGFASAIFTFSIKNQPSSSKTELPPDVQESGHVHFISAYQFLTTHVGPTALYGFIFVNSYPQDKT